MKTLVVGDSCIDRKITCTNSRTNPESSCPLLDREKSEDSIGMAYNLKRTLWKSFGHEVGAVCPYPHTGGTKTRFIGEGGHQFLRYDEPNHFPQGLAFSRNYLKDYDCLVISDYCKGALSYERCLEFSSAFGAEGKPVFVDTKKTDISCFVNSFIKVNEKERSNLNTKTLDPSSNLITTLGDRGSYCNSKLYKPYFPKVVDVSCAGDSFLSALTHWYIKSENLDQSIEFAVFFSSKSVEVVGNFVPSSTECSQLISEFEQEYL